MSLHQSEPGFMWKQGGLVYFCRVLADFWGDDVPSLATWEQLLIHRKPGAGISAQPSAWRPCLQKDSCNTDPGGAWNSLSPKPGCLESDFGTYPSSASPDCSPQPGCSLLPWDMKLPLFSDFSKLISPGFSFWQKLSDACWFCSDFEQNFLNYQNVENRIFQAYTISAFDF